MRSLRMCIPMIALLLLLPSCGIDVAEGRRAEALALDIRTDYLAMQGCTAQMEIVADYGTRVYEYSINLTYEKEGDTLLSVTGPEHIAGVTARLRQKSTVLEYDGVQVETGPLVEDGMSPVDAVPALLACAQDGFIAVCGMEELDGMQVLHICSRPPEAVAGEGREICLWFQPDTFALLRGEIAQDGYTVIQCTFTAFQASATQSNE